MRFSHIAPLLFLAASAAAQPSANAPVHKTGTVVVRTAPKYVLIALSPSGGGKLDDLWVFWPLNPLAPSVTRYEHAHIEYDGIGTLVIIHAEKKEVRAFVAAMAPPRLPAGFSATTLEGFGLNHQVGEEQLSGLVISKKGVVRPSSSRQVPFYDICSVDFDVCWALEFMANPDSSGGSGGTGQNCVQGGPGASACSYTRGGGIAGVSGTSSCSVTCNTGYYACCYDDCTLGSCTLFCKCIKQ